MLEFLKCYWRELASLLCLVGSLVIFLIKKPVTSSLDSDILSNLAVLICGWMKSVEAPGNGDYKKSTVINLALRWIKKRLGRDLSEDEVNYWSKRISVLIELFLTTPTKKGEY